MSSQASDLQHRAGASIALQLLAPALLCVGAVLLDPWIDGSHSMTGLALNVAPVLLVYLVGLSLFRRASLAALISFVPLALIHYINSIKLEELGQPFTIHDFGLTGQLLADLGLFVRYSHGAILFAIVALVSGAAALAIRRETPLGRGPWQYLALVAAIAGGAWMISAPAERVYEDAGFYDRAWAIDGTIEDVGLVAQLVAHSARRVAARPERDPQRFAEVAELGAAGDEASTAPGPRREFGSDQALPDVIAILSESFFDPSTLAGLDDCEALPRWCDLLSQGVHGTMTVPTFGGNTTRTEFEFLTGVPYRALAREVYAYNSVVTQPTRSIAWTLRHAGYRTAVIHPHSRGFWNRDLAMPRFGFDRFLGIEDFEQHRARRGYWVSDTAMTDAIFDLTETLESPWFVFGISMENHGPWNDERPGPGREALDRIPVPATLADPEAHSLRQFTYHARAAVLELERLIEWMQERERPTLVLFFGDHLPSLDEVFMQAGFDHPAPMNRQPVPWLLVSNRRLRTADPGSLPDRSHELGLWLIEQSGAPLCEVQRILVRMAREPELRAEVSDEDRLALYAELLHRSPDSCAEEHRAGIGTGND